jgi:hypothetical protein
VGTEKKISFAEAKAALEASVYEASKLMEVLERDGLIHGNGHHARQAIANSAVSELKERWIGDQNGPH